MKKRVLLIHNDMAFVERFGQLLSNNAIYELAQESYWEDGITFPVKHFDAYDIVIAKDAIRYNSGLYLIKEALKHTRQVPQLVLLQTPFLTAFMERMVGDLNITCLEQATEDVYSLIDALYSYDLSILEELEQFDLSYEINRLLAKCGMPKERIGYKYHEYLLYLMFSEKRYVIHSTMEVYEEVAQAFETTMLGVEKALRSCLKTSVEVADNYFLHRLLGLTQGEPDELSTTVSNFIMVSLKYLKDRKRVVDYRRMDHKWTKKA